MAESRPPLTRPRRRALFGTIVGLVWGFGLVILWGPSSTTWVSAAGGTGDRTVTFGALAYLSITTADISTAGVPGPASSRGADLSVRALVLTAALGAGLTLAGVLGYWAGVSRLRLLSLCDECGYDLRGIASGSCPECGTRFAGPDA